MKPVPDFENDPTLTPRQKTRRREYYADRQENIRKSVKWVKENPIQYRKVAAKSRDKNRQQRRASGREYMRKRRPLMVAEEIAYRQTDAFRDSMRKHHRKLKEEAVAAYGGACACCGESTHEFLAFDHIYNDGAKERREKRIPTGTGLYRWLKNNGYPKGRFQLLCHNCNGAKGYYGICPHEVESRRLIGIVVEIPRIRRVKVAA